MIHGTTKTNYWCKLIVPSRRFSRGHRRIVVDHVRNSVPRRGRSQQTSTCTAWSTSAARSATRSTSATRSASFAVRRRITSFRQRATNTTAAAAGDAGGEAVPRETVVLGKT